MKKVLFAVMAIAAISLTSCKKTETVDATTTTVDTTAVETTVDTTAVDTTKTTEVVK
jgi:outer membrane lipoprotein SlyB